MGCDGDINQLTTMGHHLSRGEVMVDPQESILPSAINHPPFGVVHWVLYT